MSRARGPRRRPANWRSAPDRKSTRLNSSHDQISYAVFCLKKKNVTLADPASETILAPGVSKEGQLPGGCRFLVLPSVHLPDASSCTVLASLTAWFARVAAL